MTRMATYMLLGALVFAYGCKRQPSTSQTTPSQPATPTAPADPTAPATSAPETVPATNAPTAGTVPAGPSVQGDPIADLPDYPNGTRVKYQIGSPSIGFTRSIETEFITNDTFESVRTFYLDAIQKNGWRIVRTQQKPGEVEWDIAKGTSIGEIEIDVERTGGVSVKLERQDR
jgi:hypothetical protein